MPINVPFYFLSKFASLARFLQEHVYDMTNITKEVNVQLTKQPNPPNSTKNAQT
jgi:hypothetical protein